MEDNLPSVLDGDDAPVTVEELEGVVRRAGQRRQATLVAGAAALLVLGGVGGAIARGSSNARPIGMAGQAQTSADKAHGGTAVSGSAFAGQAEQFTPLFRREANGVGVRAYQLALPPGLTPPDPACARPSSFVQAELSSAAAVGFLFAPEPVVKATPEANDLAVLTADSFGIQEGEVATGAVVRSGPGIASVRITTPTGTDTMTPQNGITVLVVTGRTDGNVEGLGADGAVVATKPIVPPPSGDRIITGSAVDAGPGCAVECTASTMTTIPAGSPPPPAVRTTTEAKPPGPGAGPDVIEGHLICGPFEGPGPLASEAGKPTTAPATTTVAPPMEPLRPATPVVPATSGAPRSASGSTSTSTPLTSTSTAPASAAP